MHSKYLHKNSKALIMEYIHTHTHTHTDIYICIYIYIYILSKLAVKGDPKVPFSMATIWTYRRGHYSFPWIALLTLDL